MNSTMPKHNVQITSISKIINDYFINISNNDNLIEEVKYKILHIIAA